MSILTGLDNLLSHPDLVRGKRVGLVTNGAGLTHALQRNIDALRAQGVQLVALYGPEHGLSGAVDHGQLVASGRDACSGLPIFSLYGETFKPTREMLADTDLLLFDLQDAGVRFYTYSYTLARVMEACAEFNVPLVVLDRPNPIGGVIVEGPILDPALTSTVGYGPIPLRYGMTMGELAQFYNRELNIGADLQVIPLAGWQRGMWYDDTGRTWAPTSPNMAHLSAAMLYPGICLVEGTNLSVGRGTALPFEIAGAPWLDGCALAAEMNALGLPGVAFSPIVFTPGGDKFANETCQGVQAHVVDRGVMRPVSVGLHLIAALCRTGQFEWAPLAHFDKLIGDASVRGRIGTEGVEEIVAGWTGAQAEFVERRAPYLLYQVEN